MLRWLLKLAKGEHLPLRVSHAGIRPDQIHPHAHSVVKRLVQAGHSAYIVGGAVRDILLDLTPKDFDVATSAHPNEVRRLFRNSVIIGRRFRLVHVLFGDRRVVEVATFRSHHGQASGEEPVRQDNVFGSEKEDAFRRDFTMNALFYDVTQDQIVDYTGGLKDLKNRVIRCIGDPRERIPEDPVRILRAIKFAAKFGLSIESRLEKALLSYRDTIKLCSNRRLFEEFLKILKSASLTPFILKSREYGFLEAYLPFLHRLNERDPDYLMRIARASDKAVKEGPSYPALCFSLLLWPEIKRIRHQTQDIQVAIRRAILEFSQDYQISKMDKIIMRNLLSAKLRLDYYYERRKDRKPVPFRKIRTLPDLEYILQFYRIIDEVDTGGTENWKFWADNLGCSQAGD